MLKKYLLEMKFQQTSITSLPKASIIEHKAYSEDY